MPRTDSRFCASWVEPEQIGRLILAKALRDLQRSYHVGPTGQPGAVAVFEVR
jgi:hypothetical protein